MTADEGAPDQPADEAPDTFARVGIAGDAGRLHRGSSRTHKEADRDA